jgi:hypothetical protein
MFIEYSFIKLYWPLFILRKASWEANCLEGCSWSPSGICGGGGGGGTDL